MYGNKKKGGERYYEEAREYVEVSDVVYCERQLYLFYCLLRLASYKLVAFRVHTDYIYSPLM